MGRKIGLLTAVVAVLLACAASAQAAGSVVLCVPSAAGKAIVSGGREGTCDPDATKVALPASADEQQTLLSLLPHISFDVSGGEPTIRFSGVNVQVVNGTGNTSTANGRGNLIIGYDEQPYGRTRTRTGSHNLVLGIEQSFTSFGGLIGGDRNTVTQPFSAVFGFDNTASGYEAVVSGGESNTASGDQSVVSGGQRNTAGHQYSAVSGGVHNTASGFASSVFGCQNVTVSNAFRSNPSLCP